MGVEDCESDQCLCRLCNCGKHKICCKPPRLGDNHMDCETEYNKNYIKYSQAKCIRVRPPVLVAGGGEFSDSTENRDKFTAHQLPPPILIKKGEYVPNPAVFDGMTTQRQDYRPWPLTKIEQRPHEPWVSSSGKFDGLTTNKAAFQSFTVPPRLAPEPRKYLRSVAKFEGVSTHAADYKAWQIAPFIVHQTNQRHIYEEDRDFKSTTAATYVGHQPPREPIKVQTYERPPPLKLESVTTNREAFQKWPMPPKLISPKNHLAASSGPFYGLTTYNDTFTPKSIERKVKVRSHYAMKPTKFDATSTHRADYTGEPCASPKVLDFRPRARYIPTEDDRDFLTTTKAQHDEKPLPLCKVAELMKGKEAELRKDGHMYLKVANA